MRELLFIIIQNGKLLASAEIPVERSTLQDHNNKSIQCLHSQYVGNEIPRYADSRNIK